jgi:hypothetical protein
MGQAPSQSTELQAVSGNPYVGYGESKLEAIHSLNICLKYYGLEGVKQSKQIDRSPAHGLVVTVYFVYNGDQRIPIHIDLAESGYYRAYVAP